MKKLSIEEKAKRYDEAIEKLRSLHDDYNTVSTLIDVKEELENIFPELVESEDERVKKEIVRFIQMEVEDEIVGNKWLAWLERQGEQKPAWSEEDETGLTNAIIMLKEGASLHFTKKDIAKAVDWLKSIKDRVQPQQKQEWSKEDEKHSSYICAALDCYYRLREDRNNTNGQEDLDKARNWLHNKLKSLRPQSIWKPSEEQLKSLQEVIDVGYFTSYPNSLETLYEQLKKLRKE